MEINAIILAAGEGTRLRPLTEKWPKCLMPIHGKPLMEYWLSDLFEINPSSIFVNTSYLSSIVEEYLARDRFAGRIEVLKEEVLLGTGGTLLSIKDHLRDKPALVIHGDNWCGMKIIDLIDHHQKYRPAHCVITMMTFETDTPETCGIVELDSANVVKAFHEKKPNPPGNRANAAVYIIEPEIISWMEVRNIFDFSTEVLPHFMGRIFTVHNDRFHRDIGNIESLRKTRADPIKELIWKENDAWLNSFDCNPIHELLNR
jgi:mannose-1-phosphate guanylyltransferase